MGGYVQNLQKAKHPQRFWNVSDVVWAGSVWVVDVGVMVILESLVVARYAKQKSNQKAGLLKQ
jgi:hypothetical protein